MTSDDLVKDLRDMIADNEDTIRILRAENQKLRSEILVFRERQKIIQRVVADATEILSWAEVL